VAVDDLLYVDEYPAADSKVRVHRRVRQCGGLTGTALVAAARLGARCAYVGALADDELSQFVIDNFVREKIDTAHRARRGDAPPVHSTIIVGRQQHTRTIFASVGGHVGPDSEKPPDELIRAAGVLLIDHHGPEGTIRAARIARSAGIGVVADFERDPGGAFERLLPLVDHLVVSERFARELSAEADPARAASALGARYESTVVVTCGESGCWYLDAVSDGKPRQFAAFPVDVVDTTGCGDVFHGAYAAELAAGSELPRRVAVASVAAALKATRHGGQEGCPTRVEVEQFLAQNGYSD